MRFGPRALSQLDEAIEAAPNDPRVALLNGMTRLNAPAVFGGGPPRAEAELRKAVRLFATDRNATPLPSWGRTDAHIWLGLFSFFVIVAVALGIASVLVVSVVRRSREIGIMRATGTTARMISRIFLIQGGLTGAFASVFGGLLGAALAKFFETLAKNPDGSPIFPVALTPGLFAGASAVAIVVGLLASYGPARHAARLDPATVIRHD
jgi:predicted lysophospholipase L1 biosynthesis ABC-type transport system permease subunit